MKIYDTTRYEKPTIVFSEIAYKKINKLVAECSEEIAWHGTVERFMSEQGTLTYLITDILVYPQLITTTTVESNDAEYALWLDQLDDDTFNQLRLQGHSHVNMGVTPSATDKSNRADIMTQVNDYYIFMITNKSKQLWIQLYDVEQNIIFEKEELNIEVPVTWEQSMIQEYLKPKSKRKYKSKKSIKPITKKAKPKESKPSPYPYIMDGQMDIEDYIKELEKDKKV